MPDVINKRGTRDTLLSTEMNSLANNSQAVHASSVTPTSTSFQLGQYELNVTFGTAPSANTSIFVWLLQETDGTNFEDGSASVTPTRNPDLVFSVRAVTTAQRIACIAELPPGPIRALVRNNGTGVAFASSGNTLTVRPYTGSF